jgi:predicted DNA binding CopG/RHH family protein
MKDYNFKLDVEEQEILDLLEQGKCVPSENAEEEIKITKEAAKNHFKKDARINIRLTNFDLNLIKSKAAQEGLPYQTLISSILHKYAHAS